MISVIRMPRDDLGLTRGSFMNRCRLNIRDVKPFCTRLASDGTIHSTIKVS